MSSAIEDPRIRAAVEHFLLDLDDPQPRDAAAIYQAKQKEWKEWCTANWPAIPDQWPASLPANQQLPGDLVDEGKLLLFLEDVVVSQISNNKRRRTTEEDRISRLDGALVANRAAKRPRLTTGPINVTGSSLPTSTQNESDGDPSDPQISEAILTLQYNAVSDYVSALQELYEEQRAQGVNPAPRPQGIALKALTRSLRTITWEKARKEYNDKNTGAVKGLYSQAKILRHADIAYEAKVGEVSASKTYLALRTHVDFLLENHMLLRQSCRMPMGLSDCFSLDLPDEGPVGAGTKALVILTNCGKITQNGRAEYGACLRHKDPRACLVGALAFSLFWRWQVEGKEKFPDFEKEEDWRGIKILRKAPMEPKEQVLGQTARNWSNVFYERVGITTPKVRHAPRATPARSSDVCDMNGEHTRQVGQRNRADRRKTLYLESLPLQFMRLVADFDPEWAGSYFILRSNIRPPAALLAQVWPQLNKLGRVARVRSEDNISMAGEATSSEELNEAARAFIELMEWLREVLLQDSVFLRLKYSSHPIFKDPLFSTPEYLLFSGQVRDLCGLKDEDSEPTAVPDTISVVTKQLQVIASHQAASDQLAEQRYQELAAIIRGISRKIDGLTNTTCTATFSLGGRTVVQQAESSKPSQDRWRSAAAVHSPAPNLYRSRSAMTASSTDFGQDDDQFQGLDQNTNGIHGPAQGDNEAQGSGQDDSTVQDPEKDDSRTQDPSESDSKAQGLEDDGNEAQNSSKDGEEVQDPEQGDIGMQDPALQSSQCQPPKFKLPRNIKSVSELLQLWRNGSGAMPSVESLNRNWGARWRPTPEKNFYSTRRIIIEEVERRSVLSGLAEEVVAAQMDEERGSKSLDKVFKAVREEMRARARAQPV